MAGNPEALRLVLSNLSNALVYTEPTCTEVNRKLWNQYALKWNPKPAENKSESSTIDASSSSVLSSTTADNGWLAKMAENVGTRASDLQVLGEEWSDPASLERCLCEFLYPYVTDMSIVAEIGVGGGRIAKKMAGKVKSLTCFDISPEMMKKAKVSLEGIDNVQFTLLDGQQPCLPKKQLFHFIYAFDVFVHVDIHTLFAYLKEIKQTLAPHGRALLHVANLTAPLGFKRFSEQKVCTAGGFYFMSPDIVSVLVRESGFRIIKDSQPNYCAVVDCDKRLPCPSHSDNSAFRTGQMYYDRDYLFVVAHADFGVSSH